MVLLKVIITTTTNEKKPNIDLMSQMKLEAYPPTTKSRRGDKKYLYIFYPEFKKKYLRLVIIIVYFDYHKS